MRKGKATGEQSFGRRYTQGGTLLTPPPTATAPAHTSWRPTRPRGPAIMTSTLSRLAATFLVLSVGLEVVGAWQDGKEGGGAAGNNCGGGNGSPEACWGTRPADGGVGTAPCCWTTLRHGDSPLCLGHDVAKSWTANGAGTVRCPGLAQQGPIGMVTGVVAAVGIVALLTAAFVVGRSRGGKGPPSRSATSEMDGDAAEPLISPAR